MDKVTLRKFPYPYEAALTICSDIDGTNFDNFLTIHKFLNTSLNTEMGQGLDLPIGNSFWMYDRPGYPNSAFSYFENEQGKESEFAPIMRDFICAGILDVMHSYGNFKSPNEFSRHLAGQAIEELEKHHLQIEVWTNHGGVESVQNLGAISTGQGDVLTDKANWYHADLLLDYGVKFYWDSEASLKHAVGQGRNIKFSEAHWSSPLFCGFLQKNKYLAKGILNFVDTYYYRMTNKHYVPWPQNFYDNDLIQDDKLRDGNFIYKFSRFGHGRYDWSDDLGMLLRKKVLKTLLKSEGYLILYIHIGDRRTKNNSAPFTKDSIAALRYLSELNKAGKIWVHTTSRLLKYNLVRKFVSWSFSESKQNIQIKIKGLADECLLKNLSKEDLQGLTFLTPGNKNVNIYFREKEIQCATAQCKFTGQRVDVIPITKPGWPL